MNTPVITVYALQDGPRLRFVLDWLFTEQLGISYNITNDIHIALSNQYAIFYGSESGSINIHATSLLWENNIQPHGMKGNNWNSLYTLYYNDVSKNLIPFDLFAGIFFLLTRYEEYGEYIPDRHGRYPFTESILSKDDVLERPVVDEWVRWFRELLENKWQLTLPEKSFLFQPSYDIDIAWSYKNKGSRRWAGAALKELISGNLKSFASRCKVAIGVDKDPYDSFDWLHDLHQQYQLAPYYFILSAADSTAFDKNIPLAHPKMKKLVAALEEEGEVGIHPSYFTKDDPEKFINEKTVLEKTIRKTVASSRQHYIRVFFPETYRMLLAGNISEDYSMGYSTTLGFRAGTSHSFLWYDLKNEEITPLRIYPFCFMDTTAHYDLGLSVDASFHRLEILKHNIEAAGGTLTTIFHNFSLGTDPEWKGWRNAYAQFIKSVAPD